MKPTKIIFTICLGNPDYATTTIARMRCYANKVGADFLLLNTIDPLLPTPKHHVIKGIQHCHLEGYDEVLYLDLDVYIESNAPDIFSTLKVQPDEIYLREDLEMYTRFESDFDSWATQFTPPPLVHPYFNAGVWLAGHDALAQLAYCFHEPWYIGYEDQHQFNITLRTLDLKIKLLNPTWNCLTGNFPWADKINGHFKHFITPDKSQLKKLLTVPRIDSRAHLAKWLGEFFLDSKQMVEVGVQHANYTRVLAAHYSGQIYGIDSWKHRDDWPETSNISNYEQLKFYFFTLNSIKNINNITLLRGDSSELAHCFSGESLDAVYLDGNHAAEPFHLDLTTWWPKVRFGGVFCGHDYFDRDDEHGVPWCRVKETLDKWLIQQNISELHLTQEPDYKSWIIIKK